jgi:5-deoxy-glucuronate isomerase
MAQDQDLERYLIRGATGFGWGQTAITRLDDHVADTGIAFGVLRLHEAEQHAMDPALEGAALLLSGAVRFVGDGKPVAAERSSLFDDDPVCLHCAAGAAARVEATADCELAIFGVRNAARFATRVFDRQSMVETERRGKGALEDTAYRIVRTIFDGRNRSEARLVLGEVVNLPGRWSSYPPHHHPQPEIYHYRFTAPQGYGHAELGETVLKVRHGDTLKILDGRDHPQVAAPGYGMYYIWAIRHLPDAPYTTPEFAEAHRWANAPKACGWKPKG